MTFAREVTLFAKKAEASTDKAVRAITFSLFREVVQRTPVDTGRLKGNWQVSQGAPARSALDSSDASGGRTITAIAGGIGGAGTVTFLANNLAYAERVEYDGWSHTKAPAGMVRVSFARINTIVAQAAKGT